MIRVIYLAQKLNKEIEKYNNINKQGKGQKIIILFKF
jgi:hypothetical protein